ncbi:MAG: beta-ketoacyl-ACP synthase III [Thermomicrobiales bacterium]
MPYAAITGWGTAVPERILTNQDLEQMVETSDEWIVSRTGIRERHIVSGGESTTSLGAGAARQALAKAGRSADDVDLIVVATATPDDFLVSQACLIQAELGAGGAAFDVGAACAGFVTALSVATQFVTGGVYRRVLVIGVDTLTRYVDYQDRGTCILFGDGAGAVLLEATEASRGLLSTVLGADGNGHKHLYVPGRTKYVANSAKLVPESAAIFAEESPYMKMNGREVFKFAVQAMGDSAVEAVQKVGLSFDDIAMLIPHQANARIIDAAARRLDLPREKVWVNVDRFGNTSAASVPIALAEAADAGALKEGDNVVLVAFGAGLAWAAGVVRWGVAGVEPPSTTTDAAEPVAATTATANASV